MVKRSNGALIAGSVLAVLAAVFMPMSYFMLLSGVFLLTPVLIAVFYAWAGVVPAVICAAGSIAAGYLYGGAGFAAIALITLIVPGVVMIWCVQKRFRFLKSLAISIGTQLFCFLAAIFALWLMVGGDLIDSLLSFFRGYIGGQNAGLVNAYLITLGRLGTFGLNTGIDFANTTFLSVSQRVDLLNKLVADLSASLRLILPSRVLNTSILTGGIGYIWANWICVRRGDEPIHPFVPPDTWRMPTHMIIGLPACALAGYIMLYTGMPGAEGVFTAFLELMYLMFVVQAIGAIARRLKMGGMSRSGRFGLLVLAVIFGQVFLRWIGIYSALFGSEGLISKKLRRRDDDEDE